MGNQQSNENTRQRNYKIYKIVSRDVRSDWVRCYLDDYVPYSDGNYKYMDFGKLPTVLTAGAFLLGLPNDRPSLYEGRYIAIDVDMTRNHSSGHEFSSYSVKEVGMETIDSDGNATFIEFFGGMAEVVNRRREALARANEWANFDKQMQGAWQLQPPKK